MPAVTPAASASAGARLLVYRPMKRSYLSADELNSATVPKRNRAAEPVMSTPSARGRRCSEQRRPEAGVCYSRPAGNGSAGVDGVDDGGVSPASEPVVTGSASDDG